MKFTEKLKKVAGIIIVISLRIAAISGIAILILLLIMQLANIDNDNYRSFLKIVVVICGGSLAVVVPVFIVFGIITFVKRVIDFIGFARCDYCKKIYHTSQQKVSATRQGDEERPKFGSDYSVNVRFEVRRPCCGKTVCEVCRVVGDCRGVSDSDIMFAARSKFGVSHFSVSVSRF